MYILVHHSTTRGHVNLSLHDHSQYGLLEKVLKFFKKKSQDAPKNDKVNLPASLATFVSALGKKEDGRKFFREEGATSTRYTLQVTGRQRGKAGSRLFCKDCPENVKVTPLLKVTWLIFVKCAGGCCELRICTPPASVHP
jgi:hypothetical protein